MSQEESSQNPGRDLISGLTQFLVLLVLRNGPQHGYELATILEPVYGRRLSPGTIYPLLKRMEKKGYVQSRTKTVSGRERKIYVLTRSGRVAMENAQDALKEMVRGRGPNLDQDDLGAELLDSLAQFRILLVLDKDPMHGYELVDKIESFFGRKIALGTIYPSLHRLAEKGYIESQSEWEGERERKVYQLTTFGERAFSHALDEISKIVEGVII
ncbi:MAG: hypothetical protein GF308_19845 [Candidatus Heimdallarchaeota archaeon]|nr:hypothetical protein [Candidatus Heimdallarchaeota archaeon]